MTVAFVSVRLVRPTTTLHTSALIAHKGCAHTVLPMTWLVLRRFSVCGFLLAFAYQTCLQITDATQELSAIWSEDRGSKYVGFLPADGDYRRIGKLRAFLSGGFLLPRDYGVDIRVVTVNPTGAGASIKFQWKLSSQKVRLLVALSRALSAAPSHFNPALADVQPRGDCL